MKSVNSINWDLLCETNGLIRDWATGSMSTSDLSRQLAHSSYAGEFRRLVRERGTTEGRKLARKALRYRGVNV